VPPEPNPMISAPRTPIMKTFLQGTFVAALLCLLGAGDAHGFGFGGFHSFGGYGGGFHSFGGYGGYHGLGGYGGYSGYGGYHSYGLGGLGSYRGYGLGGLGAARRLADDFRGGAYAGWHGNYGLNRSFDRLDTAPRLLTPGLTPRPFSPVSPGGRLNFMPA